MLRPTLTALAHHERLLICCFLLPHPPRPASSHAARLMAAQGSGLIVNVSFYMPERGTTGGAGSTGGSYIGNLYYDLAKAALNR